MHVQDEFKHRAMIHTSLKMIKYVDIISMLAVFLVKLMASTGIVTRNMVKMTLIHYAP